MTFPMNLKDLINHVQNVDQQLIDVQVLMNQLDLLNIVNVKENNMEWVVKIENVENQRIRIMFDPLNELVHFRGEYKQKNMKWVVFSIASHNMVITLEQLQEKMEEVVSAMRKRIEEYENLAKGFTVLKMVAFEENSD